MTVTPLNNKTTYFGCLPKRRLKFCFIFSFIVNTILLAFLNVKYMTSAFKQEECKQTRGTVTQENTFSDLFSPESKNRTRYIIYSCEGRIGDVHCSGWGNRLIGIIATYILADATSRTFGIQMNNPCNLTDYLVPNSYNWSISDEKLKGLSSTFMDVRNNPGFTNSLKTLDLNKEFHQDVIYIQCNQDYHWSLMKNKIYKYRLNWLKGLTTPYIYKRVIENLFKLHPGIQNRLDAFLAKAKHGSQSMLICAQIRMGRNPTIPWDNRVINSLEGVQRIWAFLRKHDPSKKIFVTTDSQQVREQVKKKFGPRVLDTEGEIIHMDKAYRGDVCRGMAKMILDQWILINCNTLLISESSFGRIPAFIRGTPLGLFLFKSNNVIPWNPF